MKPEHQTTHMITALLARYAHPETYYALLTRCVYGLTLLVAAIAVIWKLSPEAQGYFFAFCSMGAFFQLCDFGISYAVLQTASYLVAAGRERSLPGLMVRTFRLNFTISIGAAILVGAVGRFIFSNTPKTGSLLDISWQAPWAGFVCSYFLMQLTVPLVSFVEGAVSAALAWRFRMLQEIFSSPVFVAALIFGAGLWSLTLYWSARFIVAAYWLLKNRQLYLSPGFPPYHEWGKQVWPFQWRIGISTLSGFLIFYAFNPIMITEQGPVIAGRFGFSLALMNMLLLFTPVWPQSQVSRYARLLSQMRLDELRRSFLKMLTWSTMMALTVAALLTAGMWLLIKMEVSFAGRFADLLTTSILLATAVIHHVIQCFAVLLRAGRKEPLLIPSVLGGIGTVLGVWLSAHFGGPREVAITSFFCALAGIPIAYILYIRQTNQLTGK